MQHCQLSECQIPLPIRSLYLRVSKRLMCQQFPAPQYLAGRGNSSYQSGHEAFPLVITRQVTQCRPSRRLLRELVSRFTEFGGDVRPSLERVW